MEDILTVIIPYLNAEDIEEFADDIPLIESALISMLAREHVRVASILRFETPPPDVDEILKFEHSNRVFLVLEPHYDRQAITTDMLTDKTYSMIRTMCEIYIGYFGGRKRCLLDPLHEVIACDGMCATINSKDFDDDNCIIEIMEASKHRDPAFIYAYFDGVNNVKLIAICKGRDRGGIGNPIIVSIAPWAVDCFEKISNLTDW